MPVEIKKIHFIILCYSVGHILDVELCKDLFDFNTKQEAREGNYSGMCNLGCPTLMHQHSTPFWTFTFAVTKPVVGEIFGWGRPTSTHVPWRQGFRLQQGTSVGAGLPKPIIGDDRKKRREGILSSLSAEMLSRRYPENLELLTPN